MCQRLLPFLGVLQGHLSVQFFFSLESKWGLCELGDIFFLQQQQDCLGLHIQQWKGRCPVRLRLLWLATLTDIFGEDKPNVAVGVD